MVAPAPIPGRNILVLTPDVLAERMAGPAIRAFKLASTLAVEHSVRLVSTSRAELSSEVMDVHFADDLTEDAGWAEIIVLQGDVLFEHAWLKELDKVIVVDAYDPVHLEKLEETKELGAEERRMAIGASVELLNEQLERADFLLCASERQRLFWLGQLAGLGRIAPDLYDEDTTLRSLLSIVPFGMDEAPPVQREHGLRGRIEGIGLDDKVIVWGGGIYNWFDPQLLVRAVAALGVSHPDLRLVFMGTAHPNPDVPRSRVAREARELAIELGVLDRSVFFLSEWVPFEQRADYLLDADLGASVHLDHLETTLSFRTRILDYLWCGLPIVTTDGDSFADIVREHGFGRVVPPGDLQELESALEALLYDRGQAQQAREKVAAGRHLFTWEVALRPLLDFCRNPALSPERKRSRQSFIPARYRQLLTQIAAQEAYEAELRSLVQAQTDQLTALRASRSWRITAPLRTLANLRSIRRARPPQ